MNGRSEKVVEFMAKKYYVVWVGRKRGVFTSWQEVEPLVTRYPGAKFKAFPTREEAEAAFQSGPEYTKQPVDKKEDYIAESLSVDAACSGNPGPMEYQGVWTKTGERLFHFGPVTGTNNIGEFLAIVHALAYLKEKNMPDVPIYTDSEIAMKWVANKRAQTTLPKTKETEQVLELVRRAERWLETNPIKNPIYKWRTEIWGENKADFGRKG